MVQVNGYELNQPGDVAPWGQREFDLLSAFANLMPAPGATLTTQHDHGRLRNSDGDTIFFTRVNLDRGYIGDMNPNLLPALSNSTKCVISGSQGGDLSLIDTVNGNPTLNFGDALDENAFKIIGNVSSGAMSFGTSSVTSVMAIESSGRILVNPGQSSAVDLLYAGDSDAELFFVDADDNRVGIGTLSPNAAKLHVQEDNGDPQLQLAYDGSNISETRIDSNGYTIHYRSTRHMFSSTDDSPNGVVHIKQASSSGAIPCLELEQVDQDFKFIEFNGTSAADQTKNISTVNGDGSVEGPKNFSASAGWAFEGMIKIGVEGDDMWIPFYSADTK